MSEKTSDEIIAAHKRVVVRQPRAWKHKKHLPFVAEHLWWPRESLKHIDVLLAFAFPLGIGFKYTSTKIALVVHDLSSLVHPEWFEHRSGVNRKLLVPAALRRADILFPVSQSVSSEIAQLVQRDTSHAILPMGVSDNFRLHNDCIIKETRHKYKLPERYLLWCGNIQPYKNLTCLLKAFTGLTQQTHGQVGLVLVGVTEQQIRALGGGTDTAIIAVGRLPYESAELAALYQGAAAFVFPSLYESVGLPLLEAMAAGTPVVTSDIVSLRQTVDDNAVFVDPRSVVSIQRGIHEIITNQTLRSGLIASGKKFVASYTWRQTAEFIWQHINDSFS
jgi:glycosyltransferase involved in cell wall biosynthesis